MKVTLGQVISAQKALAEISKERLKMSVAINLKLLVQQLDNHVKLYEETRQQLCETYGELTEDNQYQFKGENAIAFSTEYNDLVATEVEVNNELKLEDLVNNKGEQIEISMENVFMLDPLFSG